jgi:hypothetical protein
MRPSLGLSQQALIADGINHRRPGRIARHVGSAAESGHTCAVP